MDLKNYKTDYEIQQDMHAFFDTETRRIVDDYLERYPDHDISEHVAFTLVGISTFLTIWYCNRDKINMTDELYDRVILMFMKLIPRDWHFLENLEAELIKTGTH